MEERIPQAIEGVIDSARLVGASGGPVVVEAVLRNHRGTQVLGTAAVGADGRFVVPVVGLRERRAAARELPDDAVFLVARAGQNSIGMDSGTWCWKSGTMDDVTADVRADGSQQDTVLGRTRGIVRRVMASEALGGRDGVGAASHFETRTHVGVRSPTSRADLLGFGEVLLQSGRTVRVYNMSPDAS